MAALVVARLSPTCPQIRGRRGECAGEKREASGVLQFILLLKQEIALEENRKKKIIEHRQRKGVAPVICPRLAHTTD